MPVKRQTYISVRCDRCYAGEDLLESGSIKEIWQEYLADGWSGTPRKCYCPKCTEQAKGKNNG